MVTFDARDAGTGNDAWLADGRLARLPTLRLHPGRELVVLAAHPDDETLGAGGLIAAARAQGTPVTVIVATDGQGSHPPEVIEGTALIARRGDELASALAALGATEAVRLGHVDGRVREDRDPIRAEVARILVDHPDCVVVAPWRGDGHRDHRVLGEIAAEVAAEAGVPLWEYPIWLWHWADPGDAAVPWEAMRALPLDPASAGRKREALDAYASQTSPRGSEPPQLHARFLENFERAFEVLVVG